MPNKKVMPRRDASRDFKLLFTEKEHQALAAAATYHGINMTNWLKMRFREALRLELKAMGMEVDL